MKAQLAENMNRSDLSPIQEGESYAEVMRATGMTAHDVAREYGRSEAHVSKTIKLLTLPENIRGMLIQQEIPWSAGYELAQVSDPEQQTRLARQLVERRLTRDGLRGQIKRSTARKSAEPVVKATRAVASLGNGTSVSVSGADLSIDRVIDVLEDYLGRLRKARTKGWTLRTVLRALKEQAGS